MLRSLNAKTYFFVVYLLIGVIQLYAAFTQLLFGDEAFYWLEGRNLAWSYSEIPGWTPWTLSLMDWLLPQHHFMIRVPGLLAAFSIPWLGVFITRSITNNHSNGWLTGLLLMTLPILGIAGTLAIPDIWIVFFTLLALWLLCQSIKTERHIFFICLGFVLALGVNVHLRFWLVILVTCIVVFWQLRQQKLILSLLLKVTLPLMLLGFIPVVLFNLQHDFALLSFQLKDRHPWDFQASHVNFFLVQIIITTPWVFYLCLKNLKPKTDNLSKNTLAQIIIFTAVVHWLVYAFVGFFSDTLRLNVHWTLVSYTMLLIVTEFNLSISSRLMRWTLVTGITANLCLLLTLNYWLLTQTPDSNISKRITHHAQGWQQLAKHTDKLLLQNNQQTMLVDHFMTLAQLKFYSQKPSVIKTLPHPKNFKHGRAKQLEIMGLMQNQSTDPQILLVEHSALKLKEMITFYQSICKRLNGIKIIDSLDINHGLKRYHYFRTGTNNKTCDIPPLVYYEYNQESSLLAGWVLHTKDKPIELSLYDTKSAKALNKKITVKHERLGDNSLFETLNHTLYQRLEFKFDISNEDLNQTLQLKMNTQNQTIFSQRLILKQ